MTKSEITAVITNTCKICTKNSGFGHEIMAKEEDFELQ